MQGDKTARTVSWRAKSAAKSKISLYKSGSFTDNRNVITNKEIGLYMKATGIVRRIDDLGRVVIPKEIRRTMRIREGDPLHTSLTPFEKFCYAMLQFAERCIGK